jgi:hypothetical protein
MAGFRSEVDVVVIGSGAARQRRLAEPVIVASGAEAGDFFATYGR